MARTRTPVERVDEPTDDGIVDGTATRVGNDADLIEHAARERAIVTAHPQRQLILSNEDRMTMHGLIVANLGSTGSAGVTAAEFDYFIRVCELRGLNPLFREAHFIKDGDGRITVQTGIDGFRKLAEDTGQYRGQTEAEWGPLYDGDQAEWIGKPGYVKVGVFREGFEKPLFGEAWLEEDGQVSYQGKAISQWAKRPRTMLRKVAEARALRAAFPRQMAGLYTDDELPEPRQVGSGEGRTPTPPAESAAAPTGATETAATTSDGVWHPADPPPAPEGLQGPLEQDPDGIRVVKPTSEVSKRYGRHDIRGEKLELVFKVKNRKHTAILWEPLSQAVAAAELKQGELVSVQGTVEEIVWQEGKPTKKEVWGVDRVSVLRDGAWVDLGDIQPTLLPTEEPPAVAAAPTPAPPTTEAPVATEGDVQDDPDDAPGSGPAPSSDEPPGDLSRARAARQPLAKAPAIGERVDDAVAGPFVLRLTAPIHFGKTTGSSVRLYGSLSVVHGSGETFKCVVGDDPPGELAAQLGTEEEPLFREGDDVRVLGFWRGDWLVVSAIGIEPI